MTIIFYRVQSGDTLTRIAARFGTTVEAIVQENGIADPNLIFVGQMLRIPVEEPPPPPSGFPTYTVRAGDTLSAIARRFGTTVEAIVAANRLANPDVLSVGQVLRIPVGPDGAAPPGFNLYVVRAGDTAAALAARFGTTVAAIAAANGLANPGVIYVGERLAIPVGAAPAPIRVGNAARRRIALTFDATFGDNQTQPILDILARYGVRATWFWSGIWPETFPALAAAVTAAGHEVENHSYNHPHMTTLNAAQIRHQLLAGANAIIAVTGRRPLYFRPPFGEFNDALLWAAAGLGYRTVLWTVDTLDWQNPGVQVIVNRALGAAQPGAIILMHNAAAQTPAALPQIIEGLRAQGFELVTLAEVLAP